MKSLPALLATTVAVILVLSPALSSAAGSVSFTSPASGSSYTGSATLSIAGSVSPAPSQADSVFLNIKNPSGSTVWADIASVNPSTGAFTDSTTLGGGSYTASGTYTISATDSFSASGSTSFSYTAAGYKPPFNMTRALLNIQGNLTIIKNQIKNLNSSLNSVKSTQTSQGQTLSSLQTSLASLATSLASLTTTVNGLGTSLSSLTTTVNGLVTSVGQINTAVSGLGPQITTAANNAQNAANAVSSTQTYVLVVAVLAAITLVLELAILVRKVS